jgi:hypothetical protein
MVISSLSFSTVSAGKIKIIERSTDRGEQFAAMRTPDVIAEIFVHTERMDGVKPEFPVRFGGQVQVIMALKVLFGAQHIHRV